MTASSSRTSPEGELSDALVLVEAIEKFHEEWWDRDDGSGSKEERAREVLAGEAECVARFAERVATVGLARYVAAVATRAHISWWARGQWEFARCLWERQIDWPSVLEAIALIAEDPCALYQFTWFAWRELGLDVPAIGAREDMPSRVRHEFGKFEGGVLEVATDRVYLASDLLPARHRGPDRRIVERLHAQGAPTVLASRLPS